MDSNFTATGVLLLITCAGLNRSVCEYRTVVIGLVVVRVVVATVGAGVVCGLGLRVLLEIICDSTDGNRCGIANVGSGLPDGGCRW